MKSHTPPALLKLTNPKKSFQSMEILSGIDLEVMPGDRIAILGASGSGKSTLLRCINLLEFPSSGSIALDGQLLGKATTSTATRTYGQAELPLIRQRIGMVFQQFNLFPHMTAGENVMEGLCTVKGWGKPQARTKAEEELERVGLQDKFEAYPSRLSGGQKQRVAIARALAMEPELLLFDEPTSALDPELVGEVLRTIRQLAQEGRTMLLVTHEIGFAYHFANRVLFLADGVIYEQGTPEDVLKNPKKEKTQTFLARHREFNF